jgi:Mn-containing catalase
VRLPPCLRGRRNRTRTCSRPSARRRSVTSSSSARPSLGSWTDRRDTRARRPTRSTSPAPRGATPLKIALDTSNIHHYLVGAQGALPVDAAGNPWLGSYVYNSGNLILDLLYNLMLESTGRLQKCRIYEMTDNKAARSTIAYLIVRDQAHENAFAKALESLGVNWGSVLPIPKTNAEQFPEVKRLTDMGSAEHPVHLQRRQP